MLILKSLKIKQFKNHSESNFQFADKFNCIVGLNGTGKTNVLESIYYLCMTKSQSGLLDKQLIQHNTDFFRLDAQYIKHDTAIRVVAKMPAQGKKVFEIDGNPLLRYADHIGKLPVVMIAPDDVALVTDGGELRRKFMDTTLSQFSPEYMHALIAYNSTIKQRNALLKLAADSGRIDTALLEIYDAQLVAPAHRIHQERKAFFDNFAPIFAKKYQEISSSREAVSVRYESILDGQTMQDVLIQRREKDRILLRTTQGIHRDEFVLLMDNQPVRSFGSQGQLKSCLLALRLAQYEALRQACGVYPLLLLDDIFDKLDMHRVAALLQLLQADSYGQIFLTDTHKARIETVTANMGDAIALFELDA